jgi:glycosyltransferase involved in cell wall biosynthesis
VSAAGPRGPDVSVVIPTRDRARQLRLSLRCAIAQHDVELEIIVIDDGSVEEVAPTVDALADARISVLRNARPLGEAGARNRGIEAARGSWIAFLDDDDLWSPSKLALQRAAVVATGRRWAYAGHVTVDAGLDVVSGSPPPAPEQVVSEITRYNAVPGSASSVIVEAQTLAVGGFDPTLRRTTDWDMWLQLARIGLPAFGDRPVVALSEHRGNVSRDMDSLFGELPIVEARHGIEIRHRATSPLGRVDRCSRRWSGCRRRVRPSRYSPGLAQRLRPRVRRRRRSVGGRQRRGDAERVASGGGASHPGWTQLWLPQ